MSAGAGRSVVRAQGYGACEDVCTTPARPSRARIRVAEVVASVPQTVTQEPVVGELPCVLAAVYSARRAGTVAVGRRSAVGDVAVRRRLLAVNRLHVDDVSAGLYSPLAGMKSGRYVVWPSSAA